MISQLPTGSTSSISPKGYMYDSFWRAWPRDAMWSLRYAHHMSSCSLSRPLSMTDGSLGQLLGFRCEKQWWEHVATLSLSTHYASTRPESSHFCGRLSGIHSSGTVSKLSSFHTPHILTDTRTRTVPKLWISMGKPQKSPTKCDNTTEKSRTKRYQLGGKWISVSCAWNSEYVSHQTDFSQYPAVTLRKIRWLMCEKRSLKCGPAGRALSGLGTRDVGTSSNYQKGRQVIGTG